MKYRGNMWPTSRLRRRWRRKARKALKRWKGNVSPAAKKLYVRLARIPASKRKAVQDVALPRG